MIIRGISCLLPGIPGRTDNVHIRSIVGRFLEHARVYAFGEDADTVYLSSADMMTRNTEHRVEIAYPVLDPACRAKVREYMGAQLRDNVKARELTPEGLWARVQRAEGDEDFNAQECLMAAVSPEGSVDMRGATAAAAATVAPAATADAPASTSVFGEPAAAQAESAAAQGAEPAGKFKQGWNLIVSGLRTMFG